MKSPVFLRNLSVLMLTLVLLLPIQLAQGQGVVTPSRSQIKRDIKRPLDAPTRADVEAFGARPATGAVTVLSVPRVGPNRQVSKNQDPDDSLRVGASETTVAAIENGTKIVVGWNDAEGFSFAPFGPPPALGLSGFGYSTDGGDTWVDGGAPPIGSVIAFGPGTQGRSATGNFVTRGDPWLDAVANGTIYYSNLAVWEDDPLLPPAGISIHNGTFSGSAFNWTGSRLIQAPNYPDDFVDKEAMATRATQINVTLTNFIELCNQPFFGFGQIELYRSQNAGSTWTRTIIQPDESFITDPNDPACGLDGVVNQGSAPALGPNGTLYVAWERGWLAPLAGGAALPRATIALRSITPGGAVGPLRTIASICSGALDEPAGYNRTENNDFPRIAVAQGGTFAGRIFVSFADCTPALGQAPFGQDTDAFVSYSDNGGATWSAPTPLHPTADGKIQFWPAVSVQGGRVTVLYYESREVNVTPDPRDDECQVRVGGTLNDPVLKKSKVSSLVDVFAVRSMDGGSTWHAPVRVTTVTTNWCASTPINSIIPNFGDYNDIRTTGPRTHATWADGRNGANVDHVPTTWYARLR